MKKTLVVLTGAGISAESGVATFRDSNGLWENHSIEDVATPQGWAKNPKLVQRFYNARRQQLPTVVPNEGHKILAKLEKYFNVKIVTQNVDDLHERGGSLNVLHLHGQLTQARGSQDKDKIYDIGYNSIEMGDLAEDGTQMRPHIVWFGEDVPEIINAVELAAEADIFLVVGTSMQVYPAASLVNYVGIKVPIYIIDPKKPDIELTENMSYIQAGGGEGLQQLFEILTENFKS
jgi:NAD-dependent deacetylase